MRPDRLRNTFNCLIKRQLYWLVTLMLVTIKVSKDENVVDIKAMMEEINNQEDLPTFCRLTSTFHRPPWRLALSAPSGITIK